MVNDSLILKAVSMLGVKEIAGPEHNPIILDFFRAAGHSWVRDDETAWCSAFLCWVAEQCGYKHPHSLLARDWLNVGEVVTEPIQGDIAIYWRVAANTNYGHVHLWLNSTYENNYGIGGNQSNMVTYAPYPKSRLLGYRRLQKK